MQDMVQARTPAHLWIVGALATLWNAFGCYDYFMTRTQGADYIRTMMPGMDADGFMAYVNAFPVWASAGWGLGVWLGLAGSVLILMRSRWAPTALLISLVGAVIGIGYQIMNPAQIAGMDGGFNAVVPYLIIAIAVGLYLYARAQAAKGVLR
ncbi:hypothetical protein [Sphingomonas lutea]|uniref:hypothetical protein n=1 Tax=Sphingomonas lutea TaxID=1045317 RepID=UPI001F46F1B0|nr:hypothetical protein [Sphingomonas lutea]